MKSVAAGPLRFVRSVRCPFAPIATSTYRRRAELHEDGLWAGTVLHTEVIAIELGCASPCLTSMVLMPMEGKRKPKPCTGVFDVEARDGTSLRRQGQRHHVSRLCGGPSAEAASC